MVRGVADLTGLAVVPVHALALAGQLVSTAGSWSLEHGAARFTPAFRPVPGTVHAVVAQAALGASGASSPGAGVPVVEKCVPRTSSAAHRSGC